MTSEQGRRVEGSGVCPSFEDLMAYADNELTASERSALEKHLASCRRCSAVISSQARIEQTYRDSYSEPSRERFEDLEAGLAGRFGRTHHRTAWVLPVAATLLVALAAIKLLGGGGSLLQRTTDEPSPPGGRYRVETLPAATEAVPAETVLVTAEALELEEGTLQPTEADLQRGQVGGATSLGGEDEYQAMDDLTSSSGPADLEEVAAGDLTLSTGTLSAIQTTSPDAPAGGTGGLYAAQSQAGTGEGGGGGAVGGAFGAVGQTVATAPELAADFGGFASQEEASGEDGSEQPASVDDRDQAAGRGYYMYRCFETRTEVVLEFDSLGRPSSPDSAYLDACFPGWKDSLDETCAESILVVPVEELPDLMD